ncbi:MAG TPA: hypothetical protein DCG57_14855 [Candidatus Riflebacteria bacterium]|jgi:hypothetical protein|nr:hypothetical protein [Candidatus Riflebacteria bacterium]
MKDSKTFEFAKKHREDVIDTLQLRLKERRVLYALLLILCVTFAYENSNLLLSYVVGSAHPVPELGERRKPQLKADMLKRLDRALAETSEDYPQYWAVFSENQKLLGEAAGMLAEEGGADSALDRVARVVVSMKEFAAHPIIKPAKNLEKLNAEMASLQRVLKLNADVAESELKPLLFVRESAVGGAQSKRNLFEYSLR